MDSIVWAIAELESPKPDLDAVKQALEAAQLETARLSISHEVRQLSYVRLARACGEGL